MEVGHCPAVDVLIVEDASMVDGDFCELNESVITLAKFSSESECIAPLLLRIGGPSFPSSVYYYMKVTA